MLIKDTRNTLEVPIWLKRILKLLRTILATAWKWIQSQEKQDLEADGFLTFEHLDPEISSVQSLSHIQLFAIPWTATRQASLSITNSQSLPKPMSIESVMPSNHLILCCPLLLLPSIFPSIRVFSNESALSIRWLKYWNFSFNFSPSNKYPGLISFRMDWLDLLAVQGTLKSLLQHHNSKASILWRSAFFTVQLSHPYMTTGKTIALTRWTFVNKVMSLLFNMLSKYQNLILTTKFSIIWMSKSSSTIRITFLPLQVVQMFIKQKVYIFLRVIYY